MNNPWLETIKPADPMVEIELPDKIARVRISQLPITKWTPRKVIKYGREYENTRNKSNKRS